jgi:K+-transporting ATPase ATPase C chain
LKVLDDLGITGPVPSDLVTASGSGLDPHLSLEAALLQVPVVAREREVPEDQVRDLVLAIAVRNPLPFAQPYVNILFLNRAMDEKFGGAV